MKNDDYIVPSVNYCVFCIVSCLYLCLCCIVSLSLPNFRWIKIYIRIVVSTGRRRGKNRDTIGCGKLQGLPCVLSRLMLTGGRAVESIGRRSPETLGSFPTLNRSFSDAIKVPGDDINRAWFSVSGPCPPPAGDSLNQSTPRIELTLLNRESKK